MNLLSMVVGTSNIFEKMVSIYLDLDIKDELEDKTQNYNVKKIKKKKKTKH